MKTNELCNQTKHQRRYISHMKDMECLVKTVLLKELKIRKLNTLARKTNMTKFIEIYFHFDGQGTVRRFILNTDEIARVEEYREARMLPSGVKEYTECVLVTKDGTRCVLEQNKKEKIIKQLLEL